MYQKQSARICAVMLILVFSMVTASASVKTVTIRVKGMTGSGRATAVEMALKATEGVEAVRVNLERGKAVIKYNDKRVTVAKLHDVINRTGMSCDVSKGSKKRIEMLALRPSGELLQVFELCS